MPPVEITFHTRASREDVPAHRKVSISSQTSKPTAPLYFTFDDPQAVKLRDLIKEAKRHSRQNVHSNASTTPSPVPTIRLTKSKRAKPTHVAPPTKSASLTPLLQPIVTRCLAKPSERATASSSSTPLPSPPGRKTLVGTSHHVTASSAGKKKHVPTPTWPIIHPYSRLTDTKNDRSTVPSPREVARAEQAERDKAKAREDSAAAARAAAALKRKKGGKRAVSRGGNQIRSASPLKEDGQGMTAEPASYDTTPSTATNNPFPARNGLKRTRSTGLGISTHTANVISAGNPAVSSPLRAVMGPSSDNEEDDPHTRKRSRLANSTRRANTDSPPTATGALPARDPIKTDPIPHAKLLAPRRASGGAQASEPMQSVYGFPPLRSDSMARTDSIGSADGAKERAKREVMLPGRLRDYEMKAAA